MYNDNNKILWRTRGPYHRHKSTKSGQLNISRHYRNGVCTWPTLRGAMRFVLTSHHSCIVIRKSTENG